VPDVIDVINGVHGVFGERLNLRGRLLGHVVA
jgi:hypothetical protein